MSMFKRKRKGEAVLFAIVALAVSGLIAVGLARIQHYGTHTLDTSEEFLKAEQYALEVTEQLRSTSYSAVAAMPKTKISSGTAGSKPQDYKFSGYYKEIVITNDGIFKDCKVNIYKDNTDRPVLSLSVAKVDPKALVWGGLSDNLDESTESGGNRSWSAQTTQNYVGGKLVNDYTAVDADGSFSAAASVDYINNKLKDYIEEEKCLNRTSKAEVGSNRQPIFVNASREAAVCNVSYRLNENTAAPNIGILRKDSAGNIQLDYWDHDSYFNGTNTPGTTPPETPNPDPGGGGNTGTVIGSSAPKYFDFEFTDQEWIVKTIDFGTTRTTYKVTGTQFAGDNEIEETYSFEFTASGKVKIYGNGGGDDQNIDGIENDYGYTGGFTTRGGFIQFIDVSSKKVLYDLNLNNHSHTRLVFEFNKI